MKVEAYRKSLADLEKELKTDDKTGLSEQEAHKRLELYGPNRLPEGHRDTWLSIFISQFQSPLIYVLLIAAAILFFIGPNKLDAFIISGILLFNAIIGTIQEGRTSNIVASLRHFIKTKSVVVRNGKHHIVDDQDLVVGDIIILKEGERVPADARVIEAQRLKIDESILTGESKPVYKASDAILQEAKVADRTNMAFKGTYVVSGSGKAIVVATGQDTQVGKLHQTIEEIDTDIPLKRELTRLSYFVLLFILAICSVLLVIGILTGRPIQELLVMLTALFICVIPEGLPVVLTLVLVTGAYRMARQNVLIKNLQGVEALGRTEVIVIDKTGTLTRNEMVVTTVFAGDKKYTVTGEGYFTDGAVYENSTKADLKKNQDLSQIGIAAALLNSSELSYSKKRNLFDIKGDPTEAALYVFAQKLGYKQDELLQKYRMLYEIPFDSDLKYHAGFFEHDKKGIAFVIGASEKLFEMASNVPQPLQDELAQFLEKGLRTVAIGIKQYDVPSIARGSEQDLLRVYQQVIDKSITILGLCGIQDSIRPEVADIIEQARDVGLQVVMATGDHKKTALYVAQQVGMYRPGDEIVDDEQLHKMDDQELLSRLNKITVFARVTPHDKVRIVSSFHKQGKIVAMTGDGINDVPSLLAADLGIAMGQIGTEVTKQAADLVLLDDSFVNIIHAIEQGRHIFYTLRRVILYFFSTNMGEILIVLFALFTNMPLPLTAAQILWLNFVTDGFLDIGLSMEPQEPDLLSATWLQKKERLVDWHLMVKAMYMAIPMGIASLIVFYWAYYLAPHASKDYARTMTLITMAMFQWFNAWNCRSEGKSIFTLGLFSNMWLIAATLIVLLLQFAISYIPFMQYIFKTVPLTAGDWGLIVAISAPIVVMEEVRKWVVRRYWADAGAQTP